MKWFQTVAVHFFVWCAVCFPSVRAATFGSNDLWLEMVPNVQTNEVVWTNTSETVWTNRIGVVRTNKIGVWTNTYVTLDFNAATFVIHVPATNANDVFDLYFKTNLTNPQEWTWLRRGASGQTNLMVSNLPPAQSFFRVRVADIIRPGFTQQSLAANDDGSTDRVPMGFSINYYGSTNNTLYVNNNGNVTFDNPQSEYSPTTLASLKVRVIAPFWADVDTRSESSALVKYGTNTVNGCDAFGVNWVNVGYYTSHADRLLSCQLVIINRSDITPGDFDLEFNYSTVQWQWGDVTVGTPPRAGFANSSATSYELPGSGIDGAFMDTNTVTGLIYNCRSNSMPGRYFFSFRNGVPLF
jgi:hypothetical protein